MFVEIERLGTVCFIKWLLKTYKALPLTLTHILALLNAHRTHRLVVFSSHLIKQTVPNRSISTNIYHIKNSHTRHFQKIQTKNLSLKKMPSLITGALSNKYTHHTSLSKRRKEYSS